MGEEMIHIILSDKIYENDVYPLVKAFYPSETIKVDIKQNDIDKEKKEILDETKGELLPLDSIREIQVDLLEKKIVVTFILQTGVVSSQSILADTIDRKHYKSCLKKLIYQMLAKETNKKLPWGILTGIRPTKLVYEKLITGEDDESIRTYMKDEYFCSDQKTTMSISIAKREIELLKDMDYQNGYSLYIGIPFCPSTCLYCSFTSYSLEKFSNYVDDYLKALDKEIAYAATCFPNRKLTTVYFGGGTPTTLSATQLEWLLQTVRSRFDLQYVREFTVEAGRPDSITWGKLRVLKEQGVDRISINPQSMQQKTLDLIGRKHTVEQIVEAYTMAREIGHENINMDLIIGLPGEKPADVTDTLAQIQKLNPDSLTVHTLALKRAARLNLEKEHYKNLKAENVPTMLEETINFAKNNDYLPYYLYRQKNMVDNLENIGYSKYGKEGLYNILIMEEQQSILALGAGGMSKFVFHDENRIERVDNVKSVVDYMGRIDELIQRKRDFLKNNKII